MRFLYKALDINAAHLDMGGDITNKLEVEIVVGDLSRIVIDARKTSCLVKTITSSKNTTWWNRNLTSMSTEVRKLVNQAKLTEGWPGNNHAILV